MFNTGYNGSKKAIIHSIAILCTSKEQFADASKGLDGLILAIFTTDLFMALIIQMFGTQQTSAFVTQITVIRECFVH